MSVETHSTDSDRVDIWRSSTPVAIATETVRTLLVGADKNKIRFVHKTVGIVI